MKKYLVSSAVVAVVALAWMVTSSALPAESSERRHSSATWSRTSHERNRSAEARESDEGEQKGAQIASRAKVSIEDAIRAGKNAAPGIVIAAKIEGWDTAVIWEVKIVNDTMVNEVKIDAVTGTVIKVEKEDGEDEHEGWNSSKCESRGGHGRCGRRRENNERDERDERGEHEGGNRY